MANPRPKGHNGLGQLRIIGGEWGSRRLTFPDAPGLRPTPDRVRETLFNWLAPYIAGARVLDVFTGSGALYFEALSRGASMGLALDSNAAAIASLRQNLNALNCTSGQVSQTDALRHLETATASPFDVVFLDPPFHQGLLASACNLLESHGWLADTAWIYTESETPPSTTGLPGSWRLHREKKAGQVYYALWQRGQG
ncbi:16S rRNA (guanine(966)-N(2))-methyltransferase RsmD [Pseudomonas syringae pv. aptata]|jgi:16S rRNA (guanine966-N2)-methyltransferase|uniref:Ribosomal RNA small subunit methyltransferase D n=20 Tax=Pseudomonas TaxID=286 RepID=A0A1I5I2L6_PSESX|nr:MULTISPECIES: 16S rRNA (guanine(966)-N(2))-methyltransferase RsmD [Pseudomonas]EGH30383.1 methyltransferase [Pseudomonas syringae pv. japonica str. M301072]EGH46270.1 methyltransferase [Pseudomonas syringae pv. pisi str. 1704B]KPX04930.1 Ribosomal RNA small subunit methyltransferase D [Pseudomonas syringae pv. cunninghamiae]ARA83332.1 16S rRNA (guanine(966)-N(2))-methyltransferase RsmD [Pseudomonas amygdali pv. lachrymans]AVB16899.1 16S rRNA (guanine(966)-N(2))-methyltransferase RsmD [Pseud